MEGTCAVTPTTYEDGVKQQIAEMMDECIAFRALPLMLIAIDASKKGHMFWPDELPDELVRALPVLLLNLQDELAENPI